MINVAAQTLFYPFDQGILDYPLPDTKSVFLCPPAEFSHNIIRTNTDIFSYDKGVCDSYQNKGYKFFQDLQASYYDSAYLCVPKNKDESYFLIALALRSLKEYGLLVVSAMNDAGGKRLEKILHEFSLKTQSETKHKARVVWAYKKIINQRVVEKYLENGSLKKINIQEMPTFSQTGIYGWNKVDIGSKLLSENLPDLKGKGADFGCGYGFLTHEILNKNPEVKSFYAIDSDWRAVQATQKNCESANTLWHDLRAKPDIPFLDFIVMNPPFHSGKKTDIALGKSMIKTAAKCLARKGKLYMVANTHLPYEQTLDENFFTVKKIVQVNGFKVFEATR